MSVEAKVGRQVLTIGKIPVRWRLVGNGEEAFIV